MAPTDSTPTYLQVLLPLRLGWSPYYSTVPGQDGQVARGSRVRVSFHGRTYTGVVEAAGVEPPQELLPKILPILSVENLERITEEELALWKFMSEYYLCTPGEVYKGAYPSLRTKSEQTAADSAGRAMARRESAVAKLMLRIEAARRRLEGARTPAGTERYGGELERLKAHLAELEGTAPGSGGDGTVSIPTPPFTLTEVQERAAGAIRAELSKDRPRPVLLYGITGSGKTEIYIDAALRTLRSGRNVLYLVPEVALSRQLEHRLSQVFGDVLLTFHSGETIVHRREVASTIRAGRYVVLGTRSALMLPFSGLGLVVVDEEHDQSYKQAEPAPRYNARDCAVVLGRIHRCGVLMGSATPSLESLYNASKGAYAMVSLTERYYRGEGARVELIDTRAERRKNGMRGNFSLKLLDSMSQVLSEEGQVVLLRTRRAYSGALQCPRCGEIPRCPRCNVPLSYHKDGDVLQCHHCSYRAQVQWTCPACGQGRLQPVGAGTERIEEEARVLFPERRIGRLDSDTAASPARLRKLLEDFSGGRIDILVGTQMVSKGFDFEGVRLVAVIGADSLLGIEDFRSDEKALQVLEQCRGRCARRGQGGMFVVQTACADHPVYARLRGQDGQAAAPGGQEDLVARLLEERRTFAYPPFTRMVAVTMRDTSEGRIEQNSAVLAGRLRMALGASDGTGLPDPDHPAVEVVGPYSPVVDKVRDQYLRCIRISLPKDGALSERKACLLECVESYMRAIHREGMAAIDVDPL